MSRSRCWFWRVAIALPALVIIAGAILTNSAVTRALVLPALGRAFGVEAHAAGVRVTRFGDVLIDDLRLVIPGDASPAGEFLSARRVIATPSWPALLRGRVRIVRVRMIEPTAVVSQSLIDESINIANLARPSEGVGSARQLPEILVVRGGLCIAEHDRWTITTLKRVALEGELEPDRAGTGYRLSLSETNGRPGTEPISLSGTLDEGRTVARFAGVELSDWPAETVPTPVRERFRALNLQGRISSTTFEITPERGALASIELDGVGITLPVPLAQPTPPQPLDAPVRVSGLVGLLELTPDSLRARGRGRVEDLPWEIDLRMDGLGPDAPFDSRFTCEGFELNQNPKLLPFAPAAVERRLRSFSSPTGTVDASVVVRRAPPRGDEPAPIDFEGRLSFVNGQASYVYFPYPVTNMTGSVTFSNDALVIERIAGDCVSGAAFETTGVIRPLMTESGADLRIQVANAPLDDHLRRALLGDGRILDLLLSPARHAQMVERGLVQTDDSAEGLRGELAQIDEIAGQPGLAPEHRKELDQARAMLLAQLQRPVFDLGGLADIGVHARIEPTPDAQWVRDVSVKMDRVNILPRPFPYPMIVEGVELTLESDHAILRRGTFRGLNGGRAEVTADVFIDERAHPDITIEASDVPLDELLIHALPGRDDPDSGLHRMLTELHASGTGSAHVSISEHADGSDRFEVTATLAGVTISPPAGSPDRRLLLTGVRGAVHVTDEGMDLELSGVLNVAGSASPGAPLSVEMRGTFNGGEFSEYEVTARSPALPLGAPIEDLVRVFSDAAGEQVARARAALSPRGPCAVLVRVDARDIDEPTTSVVFRDPAGVELSLLDRAARLEDAAGVIRLVFAPGGSSVTFESFESALSFAGRPAGRLRGEGRMALDGAMSDDSVDVVLEGLELSSPMARRLAAVALSEHTLAQFESLAPAGVVDARVELGGPSEPGGRPIIMGGSISPRWLELALDSRRVRMDEVSGRIAFSDAGGTIQDVRLVGDQWSLGLAGSWDRQASGGVDASVEFSAEAADLTGARLDATPAPVREVLTSLKAASGAWKVHDGLWTFSMDADGTLQRRHVRADLTFADASIDVGVPVSEASGVARIELDQPAQDPARLDLRVLATRARAANVLVSDLRARIEADPDAGRVLVPLVSADIHEGRLVGRARVEELGGDATFVAFLRLAGAQFAPILDDLSSAFGGAPDPNLDRRSRGVLDAELSLGGNVGDPASRRGRGSAQVRGGRIIALGLIANLIELGNLRAPVGERIDLAEASFYVAGDRVTFDNISLLSSSVALFGYGDLIWPTQALNLRFTSKATRRIPIVSEMIEGVRDELTTARVRGTLSDPVFTQDILGTTIQRFGEVLGGTSPERRRLAEIQRQAAERQKALSNAQRRGSDAYGSLQPLQEHP